jgi:hypothetical protein
LHFCRAGSAKNGREGGQYCLPLFDDLRPGGFDNGQKLFLIGVGNLQLDFFSA